MWFTVHYCVYNIAVMKLLQSNLYVLQWHSFQPYLQMAWQVGGWMTVRIPSSIHGMCAAIQVNGGKVMHICISKITIIGSDNGLSTGWRQAIICTNAGILLIRTLSTKFSEIMHAIHTFSLKKMHFSMSFGKCRPFCLGLNVLRSTVRFWRISPAIFNDVIWSQQVM